MDLLGKIRRWHYRDGMGIREIAAKASLSRNTVRQYLRDRQVLPNYPERQAPATKLTPFLEQFNLWLGEDERLPKKHRRNSTKLHAGLKALGYDGSYGRAAAYIRERSRLSTPSSAVFIPLRLI